MSKKSTVITLGVTLMGVVVITMFTHYVVTQIPQEIQFNIDAVVQLKDVDAFDNTGITPLMRAAIDSDIGRTKILLQKGANPNIASANADRDYALNFALVNGGKIGSLAVARLLIESGADVNITDSRGLAPIHRIMMITQADNRWQMLELLMKHGAQINAQAEDGSTMLHITVSMNDIDWITRINRKYGQILNYDLRNKDGHTPLELAIKLGRVSVNDADSVENAIRKRPILVGDNLDGSATDENGRTGLQLAVIRTDIEFVKALLGDIEGKRPNPRANVTEQDVFGNTALHYAMENLDPLTFAKYLLSKGAPVNIANKLGQTPLFWIFKIRSKYLRQQVAQLLLEQRSPVANKDAQGKTVLDLAQTYQDQDLINLLTQYLKKRL